MNSVAAFTNLYQRHFGELRAFILRRVGCRELAAELTNETFVRILSYEAGAPVCNQRAFLYRIAGNLAIDHHRANREQTECIDDFQESELLATDVTDPARVLCARQSLERLRRAIEALPPQCRRAFILFKFEGLSHLEIAAEFDVTRNAVEKLLIRALVQLRKQMA
ncbi:MAG: RNA polymerase sigma factor [Gallionella sp.]|nr:RNA polymerase sigma factor [Gallionella sp.]